MSRRMSRAVAVPSLTMKLPCVGETRARCEPDLGDEIADQPATEVRVAEHAAADRARRAGPRLEARAAMIDRPAHQTVDRDSRIRAHSSATLLRNLAAARADDEPA